MEDLLHLTWTYTDDAFFIRGLGFDSRLGKTRNHVFFFVDAGDY